MILFKIEDKTITGRITFRSDRDITVEILSPYQDIQNGVHVPSFTRKRIEDNQVESYVKSLLINTFKICEFARNNKVTLSEKLETTKNKIGVLQLAIDSFKLRIAKLKAQFKSEAINNIQYQRNLINFKKEIKNRETEIHLEWGKYFDYFPIIVPISMWMDIVNLIDTD